MKPEEFVSSSSCEPDNKESHQSNVCSDSHPAAVTSGIKVVGVKVEHTAPLSSKRIRKPTHKGEDYKKRVSRSIKTRKSITKSDNSTADMSDINSSPDIKKEGGMLETSGVEATTHQDSLTCTRPKRKRNNSDSSSSLATSRRKTDKTSGKKSSASAKGRFDISVHDLLSHLL